jgi:hypothetical protein
MPARSDQLRPLSWRKSSASPESDCVEVARLGEAVLIRDSLNRAGAVLAFTRTEWWGLLTRIRAGRIPRD